jgi:hypothetical protein
MNNPGSSTETSDRIRMLCGPAYQDTRAITNHFAEDGLLLTRMAAFLMLAHPAHEERPQKKSQPTG